MVTEKGFKYVIVINLTLPVSVMINAVSFVCMSILLLYDCVFSYLILPIVCCPHIFMLNTCTQAYSDEIVKFL